MKIGETGWLRPRIMIGFRRIPDILFRMIIIILVNTQMKITGKKCKIFGVVKGARISEQITGALVVIVAVWAEGIRLGERMGLSRRSMVIRIDLDGISID